MQPLRMQFSCLSLPSSDVMAYRSLSDFYYFWTFVMYVSMYVLLVFFFCSLERESSWGVREFSTLEDSSFFAVELHLVSSRCLMPNVLGTSYPYPHFFQVGGVCEMSHWSGESFRNHICRFNLSFLLLWPSFEICQCRKPLIWIFDEYYILNDKRM